MEKINGIIIEGKVYKAEEQDIRICCECDLYSQCMSFSDCRLHDSLLSLCLACGKENIFRFSPELTDKLKGKMSI